MTNRWAVLILVAVVLGACGPVKNIDPLGGLAGPQDSSRYGFETSSQGWAPSLYLGGTCQSVFQNPGQRFLGSGSLALKIVNMNNSSTGAAAASIVFAGPTTLTGKKIRVWVYAPMEIAPGDDKPSYATVFVKDGGFNYSNGRSFNLIRGYWTELTYSPAANPGPLINDPMVGYVASGFDPASAAEMGVKVGSAGTATGFSFSGIVLIDAVDW